MRCLRAVRELSLPDWFIAAGFVRNAIWDALHEQSSTPLNDVDLVYYDKDNVSRDSEMRLQERLTSLCPDAVWQVKNQARMHTKYGRAPYTDCSDAIAHWIELPTCVGVRLQPDDGLLVCAPFGLSAVFSLQVAINPRYPQPAVFRQRVKQKNWQANWPQLHIVSAQA
ncbi:nitrate reductase [Alteromonas halophila]|uniref:Nitrate reductase n=2 Tax=Alteromonas halophila TaxID=516698 RepID=A0A918JGJ7_9ALTE|nr:nitrate reductase [Alteromonas halophila]